MLAPFTVMHRGKTWSVFHLRSEISSSRSFLSTSGGGATSKSTTGLEEIPRSTSLSACTAIASCWVWISHDGHSMVRTALRRGVGALSQGLAYDHHSFRNGSFASHAARPLPGDSQHQDVSARREVPNSEVWRWFDSYILRRGVAEKADWNICSPFRRPDARAIGRFARRRQGWETAMVLNPQHLVDRLFEQIRAENFEDR